jgi:hypothetical protein
MCGFRLKRLPRVSTAILRLTRIAIAALMIVGAVTGSSATSARAELPSSIASAETAQAASGVNDSHAGPCSAVSCVTLLAIESRALLLSHDGRDRFPLPRMHGVPTLRMVPQPHPPKA